MSWDEKTRVSAFARRPRPPREAQHDHDDCLKCSIDDQIREGFEEGARWQREALLADDVIERVADVLERMDGMDLEDQARAALTEAIEGDE